MSRPWAIGSHDAKRFPLQLKVEAVIYKSIAAKDYNRTCQDGDVKATDADLNDVQPQTNQAFVPNANYEGDWYPICGHYFC